MKVLVDTLEIGLIGPTLDQDEGWIALGSEAVPDRARLIRNATHPETGCEVIDGIGDFYEIASRARVSIGAGDTKVQLFSAHSSGPIEQGSNVEDEHLRRGKNAIGSEVRCVLEGNVRHPALEYLWAR